MKLFFYERMEKLEHSIDSIVVLSDSLANGAQSNHIGISCINQSDLESGQTIGQNHLDDSDSSSFTTANQDPECQRLEQEICNLKAYLNVSQNENLLLKYQLQRQYKKDVFCDVDSAFLIDKIESILNEANKIFSSEDKLKDSVEYLIRNLWSSIAFNYTDDKLLQLTNTKNELLRKLETKYQKSGKELKLDEMSKQIEALYLNNLKLKEKLTEQNKLVNSLTDLFEKSRTVPELVEEIEENTLINEEIPQFYLYNIGGMKGYIAIDQDMSLNKDLQASPSNLCQNEPENLLKCPKCQTAVDGDSVSYEMYQDHVENCGGDSTFVCMFCLSWFDKSQQNEYLNHIGVHIAQLENDY